MGRQEYLTRLALGRSAFEDVDEADLPSTDQTSAHGQQYDSKGRPINPATEERNAAFRDAANAALSLVGVVERKTQSDYSDELYFRKLREEREEVLAQEQDVGGDLQLAVNILSVFDYTTETLIRRVQAGLYAPSLSFASILLGGWSAIRAAGFKGSFAIAMPGAMATLTHRATRVLLHALISTATEHVSERVIRRGFKRRTGRRIINTIYYACEALLIAVDIAFLPLEHYAYAQQLGLAPASPLLPSWKLLLPSNPASAHNFCWQSPISLPILGKLCSPAALILLQDLIWREQDDDIPVGSQFTAFKFGDHFNSPSWTIFPPLTRDPWGRILYTGYIFRTKLMRFLGYDLENQGRVMVAPRTKYQNDAPATSSPGTPNATTEEDETDGLTHLHRSTDLSHITPLFLSERLDTGYAKLLLLPLQALVARSVATSYLASPLPKTPLALSALPHLYRPFGYSPLAALRTSPFSAASWRAVGGYLSKLGLSLGMHVAGTVGMFFLVYRVARWQGLRYCFWGDPGRIGEIWYRAPGQEPGYHH